jgi:hypothetical protein
MNPRTSPGPKFRRRAAGYLPSAFGGIVQLSILIHFVLKIEVSQIKPNNFESKEPNPF